MKHFNQFLSVVIPALLVGCATDSIPDQPDEQIEEWPKGELRSVAVNSFAVSEDRLYAATDSGLYRTPLQSGGASWTPLGLQDKEIVDIVLLDDGEMLAGIQSSDFVGGDTTLFKTTDGGASWQPFMANYGGEDGPYTWIDALAVHPGDPQRLFARGGLNVSRSVDGGHTWKSVFSGWEWFGYDAPLLKIDPNNPDIIWAGGAAAILTPNLFKSEDGGESWLRLDKNVQIFENSTYEATIYSAAIKAGQSSHVLLGMGGVVGPANMIIKSTDGGQNWEMVLEGINTRTFTHSARNPETIYASGRNAAKSLFFLKSDDFGDTWQETELENSPGDVLVNGLASVMVDGHEVLYLGTNQGVYSYVFEE